nr:hypothetical protein Ccrd_008785 [Ipomoea batatas]
MATGLPTTCFPSDHSILPNIFVPGAIATGALNVTVYDFFSFVVVKLSVCGSTENLTELGEETETLYVPDSPTLVRVRVCFTDDFEPENGTAKDGISGVTGLGPRELNAASTGDGSTPTFVPSKTIVAVGLGSENKLAPTTCAPAAVEAVWVPWPSSSRGDLNSSVSLIAPALASYPMEKNLAPISFRLQFDALKLVPPSHAPFHELGTGPSPESSKLLISGQTPVSSTPMITSLSAAELGRKPAVSSIPKNIGVLVVCNSYFISGHTDRTPGRFSINLACFAVSLAENPCIAFL